MILAVIKKKRKETCKSTNPDRQTKALIPSMYLKISKSDAVESLKQLVGSFLVASAKKHQRLKRWNKRTTITIDL